MKNYLEFNVTANPFNTEILSSILWELPILGINEFDNYLLVFAGEDSGVSPKDIEEKLSALITNNLIENFTVTQDIIESQNWNEEWEKKVNVIAVTDRIVIKPSFKKYTPKEGQIILEIDPKMSFGTGEHETTRLMILALEKYMNPGYTVIDVGAGTAVLAICAAKLGATKVIAIDNDEWCLMNGNENVEANNLNNIVDVRLGEIKDIRETDFDLVIANINKHILLEIAKDLSGKIKEAGKLILSGLLIEDIEDMNESYQKFGLKLIDKNYMNEWAALVYEK